MIVPMKRVAVVMLRRQRERSLALLQDLGVLHLVPDREPEGDALSQARTRLQALRDAVTALPRSEGAAVEEQLADGQGDADTVALRVVELIQRRRELVERRTEVQRELDRLAPLGDFDLSAVLRLAERGLRVRLVRAPSRWTAQLGEDVVVQELERHGRDRYLALVGPEDAVAAIDLAEAAGLAEDMALPDEGPADLRDRLAGIRSEIEGVERTMVGLAPYRARLEAAVPGSEDRLAFEQASASMAVTGPLALVRGFCPAPRLAQVEQAAAREGWGLLVEDVEDPSEAPTEIVIPRWVRPIRALFSFTGVLPGYDQVDVSVPFLLFMSLFFAMIVGDAGYGLIFLALTELGRWRLPRAPRTMFSFLRIMSVCTIVWGVLTGTYFGIALLPHPLRAVQITWLSNQNHMILLSFLIGAVHLTVAHGWNVLRFFPSPRALAQFGWILTTWTMFFLARAMVLGSAFPHVMIYLLALGVLLIVAFMTPPRAFKSEWFNHVMLPLSLVSNFVDLVSYVRLFAVGAATYAIAQAFNQMAVGGGVGGVAAGAVAALVLFFGHTLNILLATMGVLVHGVRLNMLEFASHLGMEWTGRPYRPFAHSPRHEEGV